MSDIKTSEYVQTSLAQGKPKEEIYKDLLAQGVTIEAIEQSFNVIKAGQYKEDISKKTINIIVTIGAVLVGAGIFSFIAANWVGMTKPLKISIILVLMILSYGAGWYLQEKSKLQKTSSALFLLGSIIYGAGIFLIAQMFNVRVNWPDGFVLWMLGTIAMGFAVESYSLFYLAIPLGIIALIGHPFGLFSLINYNSFLLTSSVLLLIATVVTLVSGVMIRKKINTESVEFY